MAFSYGKLPQSRIKVDQNEPDPKRKLKDSIRTVSVLGYFFLFVFVITPAIFVGMLARPDTAMLTDDLSLTHGSTVSFLFWASILAGFAFGFSLPVKWWKRLGKALFFSLMFFSLSMAFAVVVYDGVQEYRIFNRGQSTVDYEQFRVANLDNGSKGGRYLIVQNAAYGRDGRVNTNQQTYDLLMANREEFPDREWRMRFDTGYCVKLRVEHVEAAARILKDGPVTMVDLIKCPQPENAGWNSKEP